MFWDDGARLLGLGRLRPLDIRYCPTCVVILNFITLGQTVWAYVRVTQNSGHGPTHLTMVMSDL